MNTESQRVFEFVVEGVDLDMRIDKYLAQKLSDEYSRTRIQKFIELGCVTVNGLEIRQIRNLVQAGDRLILTLENLKKESPLQASQTFIPIIYEDEYLLIVNKPEGMVVHPGNGVKVGTTLVEALLKHSPLSSAAGELRPGVVHRIDQATSGLVLLAKTDKVYWKLTKLFANREIHKIYRALTWGIPNLQSGTIEAPIARSRRDRTAMCIHAQGRPATTHWILLERFPKAHISYLQCEPLTGRTHQIRVHMKSIGHTLVGDPKYGKTPDKRLYLHAYQLNFIHPMTQKSLCIQAELPASFLEKLAELRKIR